MNTYKRHRFPHLGGPQTSFPKLYPKQFVGQALWLYYRFNLSHRDIEDLLPERGITVTRESIRLWCIKFGAIYTRRLKRKHRGYGDTFYIDELFIKNNGRQHYLSRAVDQDGELVGSIYTTNAITADCTVVASFVEIDTDNDGVSDRYDAFPDDPTETTDSDGDGDGVGDVADAFPNAVTTLVAAGSGDKAITVSAVPDPGSSCSLTTVSAEPAGLPIGGLLAGVENQVSFTLTGCDDGEAVEITVDFGEPLPIRAAGVKVDAESWTVINGASYTESAVTYTLVDNGVYDTNPDAGSISDPVTVASRPPTIPVMPFSLLALLGALLTYLGVKELGSNSRRSTL